MSWIDDISTLVDSAKPYVPIARAAYNTYTGEPDEVALQAERNSYSALNGSGPSKPAETVKTPSGMFDFLYGNPLTRGTGTDVKPGKTGGILGGIHPIWIGVIAIAAWWAWRKWA